MDIKISFDCSNNYSKTISDFINNEVLENCNKNGVVLDTTLKLVLNTTITHIFKNIADGQGDTFKNNKTLHYFNNEVMKGKMSQLLTINIPKAYRSVGIYDQVNNMDTLINIVQDSIVDLSNKQNNKLKVITNTSNYSENITQRKSVLDEVFKQFRVLENAQIEKEKKQKELINQAEQVLKTLPIPATTTDSNEVKPLTVEQFNATTDIRNSAVQFQVEYKTGDLIICDWLRVPGFADLNYEAMKEMNHSLNDSIGRKERVKILAQQYGIISVSVSDVGANVFFKDNKFVFGFEKKNKPNEFINLGGIDVGLWAVSVFDKDKVLEKMQSLNIENPEKVLQQAIDQRGLMQVSVDPGVYQVTCSGDYNSFTTDASNSGIKLMKMTGIKPLFTLEKVDLTLDKKPKKKFK